MADLSRWASVSADQRYRYELGRVWDPTKPVVLYVGLNPSTADAEHDDQTSLKWRGFASRWGFGGYLAGNLFGLRATDPKELVRRVRLGLKLEVLGERNDSHLVAMVQRGDLGLIVPCWGSSIPKELGYRRQEVLGLLEHWRARAVPVRCLGTTANGDPRHPLMLGYDTPLVALGGTDG